MLTTVINVCIGIIIPAIYTCIMVYIKDVHTTKGLVMTLVRRALYEESTKALEQGYISVEARVILSDLLKEYKKMKGNHGIDLIANKALSLPDAPVKYGRREGDSV